MIRGKDLWVFASGFKRKIRISILHFPWPERCVPESCSCQASRLQA